MAPKSKVIVSIDPPKHRLTSTERRQAASAAIATKQQDLKLEAEQRREKRAREGGLSGSAPTATIPRKPASARRSNTR
jgi:hypothetical protein